MSTRAADSALVVGGGIAGLTAAAELARAGLEVDLIEREPEPVFRGIGILLLPPAVRSMHMLGLADACLAAGVAQYDSQTHTADGQLIGTRPMRSVIETDHPPGIGLGRPILGEILYAHAAKRGVQVRSGVTVTDLVDRGDAVEVELSDGTDGRYDFVVGADGVRSETRRRCFPEHPEPEYIGQCAWRVRVGHRPPDVNGQLLFLGATTRAGFNPILPDDMYLYCLHQSDEPDSHLSEQEANALLLEQLAEYGGLVAEVRDRLTPSSPCHYGPLHTTFVTGPWYRGRVILIGDAAHATPPHLASGAGIALEDAIVLARAVRECDSVAAAFELFMAQRYERCRLVIDNSRALSRMDLDPDASAAEANALMAETWVTLGQPI